MSYNYRCHVKKCGTRLTLKKHINLYMRRPHCPACKQDTLNDRTATERARTKTRTCKCDGYPHPHHKGTEPWCEHAKIGPTDEDWEERHGR